jgi:hypothetical protein
MDDVVTSAGVAVSAVAVAAVLGLVYGTIVGIHHRATRGLRPDVRDAARRERHRNDGDWLLVAAVVALVFALLGLRTEPVTSAVLVVVAAAVLGARHRWFRVVRPGVPPLTLRSVRDDVTALPRDIARGLRQSMRLRRR